MNIRLCKSDSLSPFIFTIHCLIVHYYLETGFSLLSLDLQFLLPAAYFFISPFTVSVFLHNYPSVFHDQVKWQSLNYWVFSTVSHHWWCWPYNLLSLFSEPHIEKDIWVLTLRKLKIPRSLPRPVSGRFRDQLPVYYQLLSALIF